MGVMRRGVVYCVVFFCVVFGWVCICVGVCAALALALVLVSGLIGLGCIVLLFRCVLLRSLARSVSRRCGKRAKILKFKIGKHCEKRLNSKY